MEITNMQIEQLANSNALSTLLTSTSLPIKIRFRLSKLDAEIQRVAKLYFDMKQSLIQEYCDKDENGNPKTTENSYTFVQNQEEFTSKLSELLEVSNEMQIDKIVIPLNSLEDIPVNARDINILKPVIEFIEDQDSEESKKK